MSRSSLSNRTPPIWTAVGAFHVFFPSLLWNKQSVCVCGRGRGRGCIRAFLQDGTGCAHTGGWVSTYLSTRMIGQNGAWRMSAACSCTCRR